MSVHSQLKSAPCAFIHSGSRRVDRASANAQPDSAWACVSRNADETNRGRHGQQDIRGAGPIDGACNRYTSRRDAPKPTASAGDSWALRTCLCRSRYRMPTASATVGATLGLTNRPSTSLRTEKDTSRSSVVVGRKVADTIICQRDSKSSANSSRTRKGSSAFAPYLH